MNSTVKAIVFWLVILVSAILLWEVVRSANSAPSTPVPEISYSQFVSQVDAGNVTKVRIAGTTLNGTERDGSSIRVIVPANQELVVDRLRLRNVEIWFEKSDQSAAAWLVNLAPLLLLAVLWFFMIRQIRTRSQPGADAGAATSASSWQIK